jgi:nodulation protein E
VISALGRNREEFWDALVAGRSGIGPLTLIDNSLLRFKNAAEVRGHRPEEHFDSRTLSLLDRFAQFGLLAAREAVTDAGVEWTPELRARTGVVTGSGIGGQSTQDDNFRNLYQERKARFSPFIIPRVMPNAVASHISMQYETTGPAFTISTACSSSTHAIGQAFWAVRSGLCDLALTGGSEAPLSLGNLKAWEALRVVAPDTCRPFSKNRQGMILGEGGAMLVLEPIETARARGVRIYAEIVGFGMSADAHHITQPSSAGAAKAVLAALEDAKIAPERIGYVNAHGTGTLINDPMEAKALHMVFGKHVDSIAVSSTKSMHGHTIGAAGAIEAVGTVLALHRGILPPTANFLEPDPECDLDVIIHTGRAVQVEGALSNSFAFGGLNAVLAFTRWQN